MNLNLKTQKRIFSGILKRTSFMAIAFFSLMAVSQAQELDVVGNGGNTFALRNDVGVTAPVWQSFYPDANATYRGFIQSHNDGRLDLGANGGEMRFYTGSSYKMYLASDGKLGLGTATPDSEFHIVHNSTSGASGLPHINVEEASANDFARIKFSSSSSDFWTLAGAGGTTDKFNIFYHNGNSGTNRLSVDATEGTTILGSENTGTVAALNITSVFAGGTQTLLMDGNEIDCNDDAMHLNRNSLNKVNIRTAVERADVNLKHALGSGVDDGFAIENEAANGEFWTMYVVNSNGDLELYHQGTAVGHFDPASGTYSATSDRNRKQDIRAFNNILGKVMQLEPSVYKFKNDGKNKDYLGFIAQDIAQYFPEVVSVGKVGDTEEELYTMDYSALGVIAIEAIQEQQEVIEAQKSEIDALRAEIEAIKEIIKK